MLINHFVVQYIYIYIVMNVVDYLFIIDAKQPSSDYIINYHFSRRQTTPPASK